jgi:hypothetical protein
MQRINFIKALGLAGIGLQLGHGFSAVAGAVQNSNQKNTFLVQGKVTSNGSGVAGVQVTDGFVIVSTDKEGKYVFQGDEAAEFIYITIPSGYEFPAEKGIACFYKKIKETKGAPFNADFELKKLHVDDSKHFFIVWADPQIETVEDVAQFHGQSVPDTKDLIANYGSNALFHGIGCGDLIWDYPNLYQAYEKAVNETGIPFFQVAGNHDVDISIEPRDYTFKTFKKHFGPLYYSFNRGFAHYIVLGDVYFLGQSGKYVGYITENQIAWVKKDLANVKPGSTIVVSLHIPLQNGIKRRNNLKDEVMKDVVANKDELLSILSPFNAHIISGHLHANEKIVHSNNIIEHVHGTLCGAWWTGTVCNDGCPNGYGVYEVNGNSIQWYHKAIGHTRDYQMTIYPIGSMKEKPDFFAVNVWNWDPHWKVEWFENGEYRGELRQEVLLDPLSILLYEGDDKPFKRKWIEPALTDHIFIGQPSSTASKISIQVTDRFNNVYKNNVPEGKL